jgi:two-component system cell cycle response regulator
MNRLGNILIHGTDPVRSDRMSDLLVEGNCNVVVCETADEMWQEVRDSRPDLVIIDVGSLGRSGIDAAAEFRRRKLETLPVLLWAADEITGLYAAALAAQADDVFAGDLDSTGSVELMVRLRPLMRLSTQLAEVRRRTVLARDCGVDIPAEPDLSVGDGPYRVLAVGDSPALGKRISRALAARLKSVDFQSNPFSARDRLFDGDFDAAVMEVGGAISVEDAMEFCQGIRNHPRLYNLPLLVLAGPGAELPHDRGVCAGASLVLEEAAGDDRLRYYLASYGRRQQIRRRIRDAIEATKTIKTRGTHTYSYTREFLRAHLAVLINEARAWQKHLTVLVFSVAQSSAELKAGAGDEAARELVRQIAQWISGLVRLEDLVANIGGGEFCVALPDTPLDEANAVVDRVTGILNYTDFAVKDVYRPVKVTVGVGYAELEADDDVGAMIGRARERLE